MNLLLQYKPTILPLSVAGVLACFGLLPKARAADFQLSQPVKHPGRPDGSAGAASGTNHFIDACDENNLLRLYPSDTDGKPKVLLDLNQLLGFPKDNGELKECDLEGQHGLEISSIGSARIAAVRRRAKSNRVDRCFSPRR